jgi:hypothetical protein
MAEYRQSAHAVFDLKYHNDLMRKVPEESAAREDSGAGARPDTTDLCGARGCDCTGRRYGLTISTCFVAFLAANTGTGETGAVHQRAFVTASAGGVFRTAKTIPGPAYVGAVDEATIKACIENQKWDEDDGSFRITAPTRP